MNEMRHILALAEAQNWRVEQGGNHLKLYPPSPQTGYVTAPVTPSDWRAVKNLLGEMSKKGFQRPRKHQKGKRLQSQSLDLAVGVRLPYKDIANLPPFPYIGQLLGQWRTEDWFDDVGLPLAEDEWIGPDDDSIYASILLEPYGDVMPDGDVTFWDHSLALKKNIHDLRGNRQLRIHWYAFKFWGGIGGPHQQHAEECACVCGQTMLHGGSLALADHILPFLEQGCADHRPEGLLEWFDPEETEGTFLPLKVGELEEELTKARQELTLLGKQHRELQGRWDSLVRAVQPHLGSTGK